MAGMDNMRRERTPLSFQHLACWAQPVAHVARIGLLLVPLGVVSIGLGFTPSTRVALAGPAFFVAIASFWIANAYFTRTVRRSDAWKMLACSTTEATILLNLSDDERRCFHDDSLMQFNHFDIAFVGAAVSLALAALSDTLTVSVVGFLAGVVAMCITPWGIPRHRIVCFLANTSHALANGISVSDLNARRYRLVFTPLYFRDAAADGEGRSPFDETV